MAISWTRSMLAAVAGVVATAAVAQTPRDILTQAAFFDRSKPAALAHVQQAQEASAAALARNPDDREAWVVQATSLGYRAKLTGSRSDVVAARKQFEALAARDPRNAEAFAGIGAWHLGLVNKFGRLVARAALGAQKDAGFAALDKAVALGGNRAMFLGLDGMLRLQLDPSDPRARQLIEATARGSTPTTIDRMMQRAAIAVLVPLRAGDTKVARTLADEMMPLGRVD